MVTEIKKRLFNVPFIRKCYSYVWGHRHIREAISVCGLGQSVESRVLQISHRLEKGICLCRIRGNKPMWGFNKANELIELITTLDVNSLNNSAVLIGKSVLNAYINEKSVLDDEEEKAELQKLKEKIKYDFNEDIVNGGVISLQREEVLVSPVCFELFKTRHSVREFSDIPVDKEILYKAIELAWGAPSSCNRQATEIYVIDAEEREKVSHERVLNADKYLIICGKMNSFSIGEIDDWLISSSIFCGYLTLALHAVGLASVIIRKNIIYKDNYNKEIRKMCKIPDNEKIILEIAVGNYKDSFYVPVSKRKDFNEAVHYIC